MRNQIITKFVCSAEDHDSFMAYYSNYMDNTPPYDHDTVSLSHSYMASSRPENPPVLVKLHVCMTLSKSFLETIPEQFEPVVYHVESVLTTPCTNLVSHNLSQLREENRWNRGNPGQSDSHKQSSSTHSWRRLGIRGFYDSVVGESTLKERTKRDCCGARASEGRGSRIYSGNQV